MATDLSIELILEKTTRDRVRAKFWESGFLKLNSVIASHDIHRYKNACIQLSGYTEDDFRLVKIGSKSPFLKTSQISKSKDLWDIFIAPKVLKVLGWILGNQITVLPGIDSLLVHYSETEFHRDTSVNIFKGPEWDPAFSYFGVVRVIYYLQEQNEGSNFGVLPGSHRSSTGAVSHDGLLIEDSSCTPQWISIKPGDCIIFDPRLFHCGSQLNASKFCIVITLGADNKHSHDLINHCYNVSTDQKFRIPDSQFLDFLLHNKILAKSMLEFVKNFASTNRGII